MATYVLRATDRFTPAEWLPDMRGQGKTKVKVMAMCLESIWHLPENVAVRALLRTVRVTDCADGNVEIDDDAIVLQPEGYTFACEVVTPALESV
jgi:hypothetical protein